MIGEGGKRGMMKSQEKEMDLEGVLRRFTLDFFGRGKHKVTPEAFFEMENALFLDVRSREEAGSLAIPLSCHGNVVCLNIPIHEIPARIDEIPKGKSIGVFCPANVRSAMVYAFLATRGFEDVRIVLGGYAALTEALMPGKLREKTQAG